VVTCDVYSNWMWVVEVTRSCPRDLMARFITWAISRSDRRSARRLQLN